MRVLVCVHPAKGHAGPTAPLVGALVDAGHSVTVITGARYLGAFAERGASVAPLPAEADFDDEDLDGSIPGRVGLRGVALARFDLSHFVGAMPAQLAAVDEQVAHGADVILCDPLFMAGLALAHRDPAQRPVLLALGFLPLMAPMPALPPPRGTGDRLRQSMIRAVVRRVIGPVQERADALVAESGGSHPRMAFMDWPAHSDGVLQMTCPGFEYPRELPAPVHFIGSTSRSTREQHPLPDWWQDLETATSPVIHVTQGTIANDDLGQLVEPAIAALADTDALVVVTTCGGTLEITDLPGNVRVADFLPYDELLPRCSAVISNGGYGGVNHALRYAVPLVVVGGSEDKREVAARVQWSGCGVGIARRSVSPRALRTAVRRVLDDPSYRARAAELARQLATAPSLTEVVDLIAGYVPNDRR